ncbi:MAG: AsmA family protein [Thermodesulfobacteriota bacterium]
MRVLKWIAAIGAVLMVVLAVAVFVVLSRYDFNSLKPQIAEAAREATGRELTISGDINLEIGLTPTLVVEGVSFQNAPWGSRPTMATIKRFEVKVALVPLLGGNVDVKRLVLVEPDILLETKRSGKSNLEFDTPKETAPAEKATPEKAAAAESEGSGKLPALSLDDVRIERGRLTYKDGRSGETTVITIDSLTASADSISSPIELALKGAYNEKPFEAKGTIGPLTALADPETDWPLKIDARAFGTEIALDGTVRDPLNQSGVAMDFSVKAGDIKTLEPLIGPLPISGPLAISGHASDPASQTYKVSGLKLSLGENDLRGSLEAALGGKRPKLKADLSSKKIDLRPLLPEEDDKKTGGGAKTAKEDTGKVFSNDPLPLDSLKQVDAAIKIKAGQILLPKLALDDLTVELSLKNGRLRIKPIKAKAGGGSFSGTIDLRAKGNIAKLDMKFQATGLDLGKMLKELEVSEDLEGKLDVEIDIRGSGGSVAELMARLDGNVSVIMGKGRVATSYINLLGADVRSGAFRLLDPGAEKEEYTAVNCFVCRFDVDEGLANTTAMVFDTDAMTVIGDGRVDLRTERLSLSLKPSPKEGVVGDTPTLSLGELAKPFKLGGTLAKPKLELDPAAAAITIGKAVGGVALFGPVGIASALASDPTGDENPCLAAIETARTGSKATGGKKSVAEETEEKVKETIKGLGEGLKKLFGK